MLTAGMVFGYAAFLLWSALSSEPEDYGCVFKRHGGQEEVVKVGLSQFVGILKIALGSTSFAS